MTTKPLGKPELEKLAATLRGMRGTEAYPPTAKQLFDAAKVDREHVKLATSNKAAEHMRILAKRGQKEPVYYAEAPVFLVEDAEKVLGSNLALLRVVRFARNEMTRVCDLNALKKAVPDNLKAAFAAAFERRMRNATELLPTGVSMLKRNGAPLLFMLEDALKSAGAPATVTVTPPPVLDILAPFPEAFGQAFDELDQQAGRRNSVMLADLRSRLAQIPRPDFDRGLNELRRTKQYSLDSADGRQGRLTPEQVEAGIHEAGSVLVYVARR
jgi:hypothetical protein